MLLDSCFNGASMACALCGAAVDDSADFDVQKVFRVVVDDEDAASSSSSRQGGEDGTNQAAAGSGSGRPLSSEQLVLQCLWQVLAAWGPEQKRAFIKFVTGSSRCGLNMACAFFGSCEAAINMKCSVCCLARW